MNKTTDKSKNDIWFYPDLRGTLLGLHRKREPLLMNSEQNKSEGIKTSEEGTKKTTDKSEEDKTIDKTEEDYLNWLTFYKEFKETSL